MVMNAILKDHFFGTLKKKTNQIMVIG